MKHILIWFMRLLSSWDKNECYVEACSQQQNFTVLIANTEMYTSKNEILPVTNKLEARL